MGAVEATINHNRLKTADVLDLQNDGICSWISKTTWLTFFFLTKKKTALWCNAYQPD